MNLIEKSGTGIERSGTGIERSGTGSQFRKALFSAILASGLIASSASFANESQLMVTNTNGNLLVSLHGSQGVVTGAMPLSADGYTVVPLFSAIHIQHGQSAQTLVLGSGSGAAGEVLGSGSGAAGEVLGSGSGATGEVLGSGSGAAGEVLGSGSGAAGEVLGSGSGAAGEVLGSGSGAAGEVLGSGSGAAGEVLGSGSGAAGEVLGSGSGAAGEVLGSGSGAAGEAAGTCGIQPWGFAEIVTDSNGMHVMIQRIGPMGLEEHLLGFFAAPSIGSPSLEMVDGRGFDLKDGNWTHDFIARP